MRIYSQIRLEAVIIPKHKKTSRNDSIRRIQKGNNEKKNIIQEQLF